MELVRGAKITDYCDRKGLNTRERLALFIQVCKAVQHAHQKGVIHRDLKPSNILVTQDDGVPIPKVIDFGIAKATQGRLTDKTLFTAFAQFVGTPAYMSPEQAEMTASGVDTRSDIYSLGVLLYELLTGKTPFETQALLAAGLDALRQTILHAEPPRPSTRLSQLSRDELTNAARRQGADGPRLIHLVRGDLDWIVMKAMAKERARRYETANGLAVDVQRYLANDPVYARPPSALYRLRKAVQRHKLAFAAAGAMAAALILGFGVATFAAVRIAHKNRQLREMGEQLRKARDEATEKLRASYLAEARAMRVSGRPGQRMQSLEAVKKAAAIRPDAAARDEAIAGLAVPDLRAAPQRVIQKAWSVSADFGHYSWWEPDGTILVHAATDDRVVARLTAPGFRLRQVLDFSPDGRYLQARYRQATGGDTDLVWDVLAQRAVLKTLPDLTAWKFSDDSRLFACSNPDATVSIYGLASAVELKRHRATRRFAEFALTADSARLACIQNESPEVEIHEVDSWHQVRTLTNPASAACCAWSFDGHRLAIACKDYRIYLWDTETGHQLAVLQGHTARIVSLAFSHAGDLLASGSWDGTTRLWQVDAARQIANHPGGGSWHFQFSPDDRYIGPWYAEGNRWGLLEVVRSREYRNLYQPRVAEDSSGPEFSPDGRLIVAGTGALVCFWDGSSGRRIASFASPGCTKHLFRPDGKGIVVLDRAGGVRLRALEPMGASNAWRLGPPNPFFTAEWLGDAALSHDGRRLAVTDEDNNASYVFDLEHPSARVTLREHPRVTHIAISPDGRWVATSSWHNRLLKVWDVSTTNCVFTFEMPGRARATFSPDGHWLAASSSEYRLWEVGSWRAKGPPLPGFVVPEANHPAFSPDSRLMALLQDGYRVQLRETWSGRVLAALEPPDTVRKSTLRFGPDGTQLAVLARDQQVELWDFRALREDLQAMNLDWDLPPYPPAKPDSVPGPITLEIEPDHKSPAR
jgi:WD40 repeat protein